MPLLIVDRNYAKIIMSVIWLKCCLKLEIVLADKSGQLGSIKTSVPKIVFPKRLIWIVLLPQNCYTFYGPVTNPTNVPIYLWLGLPANRHWQSMQCKTNCAVTWFSWGWAVAKSNHKNLFILYFSVYIVTLINSI